MTPQKDNVSKNQKSYRVDGAQFTRSFFKNESGIDPNEKLPKCKSLLKWNMERVTYLALPNPLKIYPSRSLSLKDHANRSI